MKEQIIDQLKTVYDPEITSINIFDLGLVYDIDIKDKDVTITHTPPFTKEMMSDDARFSLGL
jgi:metal-sulfur cluster biosynthetic enzyme